MILVSRHFVVVGCVGRRASVVWMLVNACFVDARMLATIAVRGRYWELMGRMVVDL